MPSRQPPGEIRPPETEPPPARPGGLDTFGGVFTPSILTILGIVMYLRLGWVVGNVGLPATLLIVTLATTITFLTGLSVSAIATNRRVHGGGAYYMISRSLGPEVGGAIGLPLYLAQGLSVALYTVGFAESVVAIAPGLDVRFVGLITTVLVALLALFSARTAIRAQYVIMGAIAVSLLSFAFGHTAPATEIEAAAYPGLRRVPFWTVFAVFFPAVTGIMAGVNMSGDLENPARSIPRGTLGAIGAGYLVYLALPIILAARADPATLILDPLVMRRIAIWGDIILVGLWGAALSSAVGSILGAPRILQALARDGILPQKLRWLGRGSGSEDTPRVGTVFTLAIALVAVWLGNLNAIAPVMTMFFLTTYGVVNLAAGVERFLKSPSYRPQMKVHWALSLLGAIACAVVMFLINPLATIVATVFVVGVLLWLETRGLDAAWGDIRRGIWMAITRAGLLRLRAPADRTDPRNWRPHILVLSGAPTRRWYLIDLAAAIAHNKALMTVATVLPGRSASEDRRLALADNIHEYMVRRGVQGLVRVIPAPNHFVGGERLVEAYGLGALRPNTILLGTNEEELLAGRFCQMIAHFHDARRNVLIVRADDERGFGQRKRIHVWWGGLKGNGGLMMILAYLIRTSLSWTDAEVKIKMVVSDEDAARGARPNLATLLHRIRTGAVPEVLVANGRPFDEILREHSREADLLFMGLPKPTGDFIAYYDRLMERTEDLPATVLTLAAEPIAFGEVLK